MGGDREEHRAASQSRRSDAEGRPGHHDPLAGIGGAAPSYSALTLRLVLATLGLVVCGVGAAWLFWSGGPPIAVAVLAGLALVAVVDLAVIVRRKRRGEPG